MRFKFLIVIGLLSGGMLSAQDVEDSSPKFSIGVNFSPNYSFRTLSKNPQEMKAQETDDEFTDWLINRRNESEQAALGINTGVELRYQPMPRLEFSLGTQWGQQTFQEKDVMLTDAQGNNWQKKDTKVSITYIEIPLRGNFYIKKEGLKLYLTGGASMNLFLTEKSSFIWTDQNGEERIIGGKTIVNPNDIVFSVIGGVGARYDFQRIQVGLEPVFRYSIEPVAKAPINQYNYSAGAQFWAAFSL